MRVSSFLPYGLFRGEAQTPFFSFRLLFGVKITADEPIKPIPTIPISAATPDSIAPSNNNPAAIPQITNPMIKRILFIANPSPHHFLDTQSARLPHGLFSEKSLDTVRARIITRNLPVIEAGCYTYWYEMGVARTPFVYQSKASRLCFPEVFSELHRALFTVIALVLSQAGMNRPETALHGGKLGTEEHVSRTGHGRHCIHTH